MGCPCYIWQTNDIFIVKPLVSDHPECEELWSLTGGCRLRESVHRGPSQEEIPVHLLFKENKLHARNFLVTLCVDKVTFSLQGSSRTLSSVVNTVNLEIRAELFKAGLARNLNSDLQGKKANSV